MPYAPANTDLAPIKIVHLITLLEMGGAQGNTLYTVEHLPADKFEVHLWSGRGAYWDNAVREKKQTFSRVRFFSNIVRPLNPLMDVLALCQLWLALRKEKPALLHTHSSKAGILGRLAARLAGVPVVIHTFHGFGFNDQQKPWTRMFFIWLERRIASMATTLVFVSQSNMDEARALGIGNPDQYALIRSGVPLSRISSVAHSVRREEIRKKLNISSEAKLVTTIGAFKPQKNLGDFLKVAAAVLQRTPNTYFLIMGDGALRSTLESQVASLRISSHVIMPGWRQDAVELLAASDAFVMTSLWEGLPRAMLEAVQVGLPVFCYETDGVRDLFPSGDPHVLPRGEWGKLADRVVSVLSNPEYARGLVTSAASKVTSDFDIDVMVRQQEQLYFHLLKPEK